VSSIAPRPIAIAPSVLPADFARLGDECLALEKAGVDRIQWDVMDGHFVPNLTFGPDLIASIRSHVSVPFEAHLMVERPDDLLPRYVEAGCGIVIVHEEACPHLHRTLGHIRELGASPAVALNPHTPISTVEHVLDLVDLVLVMTVNPGFGGQAFIPAVVPKIRALAEEIDRRKLLTEIAVDGGIGPETAGSVAEAGASVLVAGAAVFGRPDYRAAIADIRAAAEKGAAARRAR
jgi:ribulose-phosphate 3-epimerase